LAAPGVFVFGAHDIMHVVNKSQNGLGVVQNGVLGCRYHHHLLDNGNQGLRDEMEQMLKDYLKSLYPGWTEESVTYSKWSNLQYKK
jgi:predicted restriction endonuclease